MQTDWIIYLAIIVCPYKAWQLLKAEGIYEDYHLPQKAPAKLVRIFERIETLRNQEQPPSFHKIPACQSCQFWNSCHQKLKEKDCISLLGNMTAATIVKYHKRGIFTILQLSHLFKLKRKRNRPQNPNNFLWELKALAIREQQTYVLQAPEIKPSQVSIYIDFEGLPEENFIYLAGAFIRRPTGKDEYFAFWANYKEEEATIFGQLITLLNQYPDALVFHYGSYETKALKKYKYTCDGLTNILSFFRTHVYPPVYTNGLKEIAGWLGFQWQDAEANGLKSIEWRKNWEHSAGERWKTTILQYNKDDCKALSVIHDWLNQLSDSGQENIQRVADMKKYTPYRLQSNADFSEDFQTINKAAYFDYQHTKIFWRTEKIKQNKKNTVTHSGRGHLVWQPKKINEVIVHPWLKNCPHCGHAKIYHSVSQRSFIQTDIKFTRTGIKQWVIEFRSGKGKCARCAMKHNDSVLKRLRYGDNILAWSINLYVNYHISFAKISQLLQEQFGIWVNPTYFNNRNYQWWQQFKPAIIHCRKSILGSPCIHIDETAVNLNRGGQRAYVWVFATARTVFYHLALNRESAFLHEWLKDYPGVIISDFYGGYESVPVKRQKCLVHLIRDLNDDLFKNPFDEEYKELVVAFGRLLKSIVATIDRHGLKKYYLKKHKRFIADYFNTFLDREYKTILAAKCAKRLKKHWEECWTFLDHDGVPWNNNNAEFAVKAFAQHRRGVNGIVSQQGLTEFLGMLTVAQTCRYRNISFLDFCRGRVVLQP